MIPSPAAQGADDERTRFAHLSYPERVRLIGLATAAGYTVERAGDHRWRLGPMHSRATYPDAEDALLAIGAHLDARSADVEEVARRMTDGPVTSEYRALALACIRDQAPLGTPSPTLTRLSAIGEAAHIAAAAKLQAAVIRRSAATAGPALARRFEALALALDRLAGDATALSRELAPKSGWLRLSGAYADCLAAEPAAE